MEVSPAQIKKKVYFYYREDVMPLNIYLGTPANEIQNTIRLGFNIKEQQKLQFLDHEGILTVLSSYIANDEKIFVQIKKTFTQKLQPIPSLLQGNKQIKWNWLNPSLNCYKISKDKQKINEQKKSDNFAYVYGSLLIKQKMKVYFVLAWENFQCCQCASVYWSLPQQHYTQQELKQSYSKIQNAFIIDTPIFQRRVQKEKNYIFGFYVDMESKIIVFTNHAQKLVLGSKNFQAQSIRPCVSFKHSPVITIRQTFQGAPQWL